MLQDLIQAAPKTCSAPNVSRHGRFPTSTRLFPVDDVAGQWGARGYAVHLGARRPKVLTARKGAQAKWQGIALHSARGAVEMHTRQGRGVTCSSGEGQVTRRSG